MGDKSNIENFIRRATLARERLSESARTYESN